MKCFWRGKLIIVSLVSLLDLIWEKCGQLMFLQTIDMYTIVLLSITLTRSHVISLSQYIQASISVRWRRWWWSFNICKRDTTGYFKETSGHFQLFMTRSQDVSCCVCGEHSRYFKPKYSFPKPNKGVFVPKPSQDQELFRSCSLTTPLSGFLICSSLFPLLHIFVYQVSMCMPVNKT